MFKNETENNPFFILINKTLSNKNYCFNKKRGVIVNLLVTTNTCSTNTHSTNTLITKIKGKTIKKKRII